MKRKLLVIQILMLSLSILSNAQGDLLITPRRVVFEGNKQKEEINLVNIGKDTAIYSISFIQYRMSEEGSFELIERADSGQMFADPYLRIFPRRIVLAPQEPQVIMLQCRRKTNMAEGEYRSHLYFRAEKSNSALGIEKLRSDTTKLTIQLTPVFGLSIPVILRSGLVKVNSKLIDLRLETQQKTSKILKFSIIRTGNISLYGDILVEYIPLTGRPIQVGAMKGIGVYTDISKRNISIKINNASGLPVTGGKLKVQYLSDDEAKRVIFAESEMVIR